jgi:hypothetical protein
MTAAELTFMVTYVAEMISSPTFFDQLTNEGVSPDELKGTRQEANALVAALRATPADKIDAIAEQYNDELRALRGNFQGEWVMNRLQGFHDAQVMFGFVNSIFNKAHIRA